MVPWHIFNGFENGLAVHFGGRGTAGFSSGLASGAASFLKQLWRQYLHCLLLEQQGNQRQKRQHL